MESFEIIQQHFYWIQLVSYKTQVLQKHVKVSKQYEINAFISLQWIKKNLHS